MEEIFPMDVMEEILCYLPVKSLVRFRCVSKSWKCKISEPRFIRKQATRPDNNISHCHSQKLGLVVYTNAAGLGAPRYYNCSLCFTTSSDEAETEIEPVSFTGIVCPFEHPYRISIIAFCDELWLVSISYHKSLYLWNPSMRTCRKLPDKPPTWQTFRLIFWSGVGYDFVGDDYKVFMSHSKGKWTRHHKLNKETHIYSLRNDAWTKLDESFPIFDSSYSGLKQYRSQYLNGALHWVVYPFCDDADDDYEDYVIVCFDLTIDKYAELPQPPSCPKIHHQGMDESDHDQVGVAVLKGMLCVMLSYLDSQPQQLVLWTMKDYGVAESWTKLYEIRYDAHPSIFEHRLICLPRPLYLFDNGDVLILTDASTIVIYKDDHTPLRTLALPFSHIRSKDFIWAFIYVQTLVEL